tara:strand:- start:7735 stop:8337 length:603 start_codon:yes stop_codon:yes gene_type:complete
LNNNLYLVGHSEELILLSRKANINFSGIIDIKKNIKSSKYKVFEENDENISNLPIKNVVIGVDSPIKRQKLFNYYEKANVKIISLYEKKPNDSCSFKEGLIIQENCFISTNCIFGKNVRINVGSTIMHDVQIGDFVTIAPRAVVLGRVKVSNNVYIGANSTILQDIKIGENSVIGAGAVVTKNVPRNCIARGVPAKFYSN